MSITSPEFFNDIEFAFWSKELYLTTKKYLHLREFYPNLQAALDDDFQAITNPKLQDLKTKSIEIKQGLQSKIVEFEESMNIENIQVLACENNRYPQHFKNFDDYPLCLYYQGNLDLLGYKPLITVVGSRNINNYSNRILQKMLLPVCKSGVGVVSGLALGVDAAAHTIALEARVATIAVIGSGLSLECFYPTQNLALRQRLLEAGNLILSEFPPKTQATVYSFPLRNRILAALSPLTWVVQAGVKSGSLITASKATEYGKSVCASPAAMFDSGFAGNLELIKSGANLVTEPAGIMQILSLHEHQIEIPEDFEQLPDLTSLSPLELKIYQLLNFEAKNIDDLCEKLDLSSAEITSILTILELQNLVQSTGENNWIKVC